MSRPSVSISDVMKKRTTSSSLIFSKMSRRPDASDPGKTSRVAGRGAGRAPGRRDRLIEAWQPPGLTQQELADRLGQPGQTLPAAARVDSGPGSFLSCDKTELSSALRQDEPLNGQCLAQIFKGIQAWH